MKAFTHRESRGLMSGCGQAVVLTTLCNLLMMFGSVDLGGVLCGMIGI